MKYIIYWCLITVISVPHHVEDEFGRYRYTYETAESRRDCGYEKVFSDRDSAFMFYNRALKANINSVRIDSVIRFTPSGEFNDTVYYDTAYIESKRE